MGGIITVVLAVLIFGYGGYHAYQTVKKGSQGECQGCSCDDCSQNNCGSSLGYIDLSDEDNDK